MASTVIASQVSSFALVGQTLTFDSNQGGIIGFFLDIISSIMRGFNSAISVTQDRIEIEEDGSGSGSGDGVEEDYFELESSGSEEDEGFYRYLCRSCITLHVKVDSWSRSLS